MARRKIRSQTSVVLFGHKTSVSLEPEFIAILDAMAAQREFTRKELIEEISVSPGDKNLTRRLRLVILNEILDLNAKLARELATCKN